MVEAHGSRIWIENNDDDDDNTKDSKETVNCICIYVTAN